MSARTLDGEPAIEVALTMHDTNYSVDFALHRVPVRPDFSDAEEVIMHFGPRHLIRLQVGFRNCVEVDEGGLARLIEDPADYQATVRPPTWNSFMKIVKEIRTMGTKVAFFSSTPQGGGVALMRHALI